MPAAVPRDSGRAASVADSDALLVRRAQGGDDVAFAEVYRRHVGRVYAVCLRLVRERGRAEELTQDAFVRCWERLGQYRGESAFGTWLYRLAVNLILAQRQSRGGERVWYDAGAILETTPSAAREPELALDFEDAISRLPSGARQVFVLHDVAGYKHEEIGALLGIAPGTSKSQLHRARMALRGYLDR